MTKTNLLRGLALGGLLILVALTVTFLPMREYLTQFLEWVQGLGAWGGVVFAVVYAMMCLVFPASLMTLGGGFLFGLGVGFVLVSLAANAGAWMGFWLGRTLARRWVEARVAGNPRFQAIDSAVAEEGFKIVLLTRLSPVFPFLLLNYAFGLTRVRFRDYVLATALGMIPGTLMYVYFGSAAKNLAEIATGKVEGGAGQNVLFFVGLAATVVVTIYVTRLARRALKRTAPGVEAPIREEGANV